jgi:stage V sporulation protein AA
MSVGNITIYIKGDQNVEVQNRDIKLGDIVTMECTDSHVAAKLKSLKMIKIPDENKHRYVVSILKLIEKIHEEYPSVTVQNLGPADIIVTYEPQQKKNPIMDWIKVDLVVLITFFGAAYSIMAFNNDVNTPKLLGQIYEQIMGREKTGFTILELTYSIGVVIGILVFFNHFGKKKFAVDPTPMEVEMRLYENDIQTTLIENYSRKEQELDVGKGSTSGGHRS